MSWHATATLKFCTYCKVNHPKDEFVPVREKRTGRIVNYKCKGCVAIGKLPAAERDARAAARQTQASRISKLPAERRFAQADEHDKFIASADRCRLLGIDKKRRNV